MNNLFFEKPILNSPYDYPAQHWELDGQGQPTQKINPYRRQADFITPIPKPKKQKAKAQQIKMVFDEGKGLSTQEQQYSKTARTINALREHVDAWRKIPDSSEWKVTPETARLLQLLRHRWRTDQRDDPGVPCASFRT